VVIIGAGPVGLLAATFLGSQGVACLLLDGPAPSRVGLDGPGLDGPGLDGPGAALAEDPARDRALAALGLPAAQTAGELTRLLSERLALLPHIERLSGVTVHGWSPAKRMAHLSITRDGQPETLRAFWILACDGPAGLRTRAPGPSVRWRTERVFWLGGAARGTPALDAGLIDARDLAWKLAFALPGLLDPELLLGSYAVERAQPPGPRGRLPPGPLCRPPHGGAVLPAVPVRVSDDATWPVDALLGGGFARVTRPGPRPPDPPTAALLARLGASTLLVSRAPPTAPGAAAWCFDPSGALDPLADTDVVLRPDRRVWGATSGLAAQEDGRATQEG